MECNENITNKKSRDSYYGWIELICTKVPGFCIWILNIHRRHPEKHSLFPFPRYLCRDLPLCVCVYTHTLLYDMQFRNIMKIDLIEFEYWTKVFFFFVAQYVMVELQNKSARVCGIVFIAWKTKRNTQNDVTLKNVITQTQSHTDIMDITWMSTSVQRYSLFDTRLSNPFGCIHAICWTRWFIELGCVCSSFQTPIYDSTLSMYTFQS